MVAPESFGEQLGRDQRWMKWRWGGLARLQAARGRVGPPEPHADKSCRDGGRRRRGGRRWRARAPWALAAAARWRAATTVAAGGEGGWNTPTRGESATQRRGGGAGARSGVCDPAGRGSRTTRATFSSRGGCHRRHSPMQAAVRSRSPSAVPAGSGRARRGGGEAPPARDDGFHNHSDRVRPR